MLAIDEAPELRRAVYEDWARRGLTMDLEDRVYHAAERMRSTRYTMVWAPVELGSTIEGEEANMLEVLEAWIAVHAPSYRGRMLYYGEASALARARETQERIAHDVAERPELAPTLVELPPLPSREAVRAVGTMVETRGEQAGFARARSADGRGRPMEKPREEVAPTAPPSPPNAPGTEPRLGSAEARHRR